MSHNWQQTNRELLQAADYIVFMSEEHQTFCVEQFQVGDERAAVWEVSDVDDVVMPEGADQATRERIIMAETERTYWQIKGLVDKLTARLAAAASAEPQCG